MDCIAHGVAKSQTQLSNTFTLLEISPNKKYGYTMKNKYVQMIHEDSTQMSDLSGYCPTLTIWPTQGHG